VPDIYPWIATQKGDGVVELPFREGDYVNYYQMFHGKRVLGGWGAGSYPEGYPDSRTRRLGTADHRVQDNPFLLWLRSLNDGRVEPSEMYRADDLEAVRQLGYRHVVLHERGCFVVRGAQGHAHYLWMRAQLERLLGAPKRMSEERVRQSRGDGRPPGADGLFGFEVAVYDLGPPAAVERASSSSSD
jgi:hypothetical protein